MKKEELLDLISVTEAAKLRGVTRQAILDLISRGKIQAVEVGGRRFVRRSEVRSYKPSKGGRPKHASKKKAAKD